ncbi:hypothetical protein FLL45_00350 [Aliikangiella marina]|uniref:Uncharacterized protein n=1 Tax=Aliikangiella marina TaxID=1712262 RepID=A0A545TK13_9GAMM|nr:hypothetical protein FLL45_00350 [Aliikangiella marina]
MLAIIFSSDAFAGYNANFDGKVKRVITYTYSTQILIEVENQPTSHPECTVFGLMVIDPDTPDNIRQLVLTRLMTAYATGEVVTIGYDNKGSCVNGRMKVFRVG